MIVNLDVYYQNLRDNHEGNPDWTANAIVMIIKGNKNTIHNEEQKIIYMAKAQKIIDYFLEK